MRRGFDLMYRSTVLSCSLVKQATCCRLCPWDVRTILWLDYDGHLDEKVLADISYFVSKAQAGSVLVVSVNAQSPSRDEDCYVQFERRVGKAAVPVGTTWRTLQDWGTADATRSVILNGVQEQLSIRN